MKYIVIEKELYRITDAQYRVFESLRNGSFGDSKANHYAALEFITETFEPACDLDGVFNF